MTRALILGGGMVGSAIAADLAADARFDVTVADVRQTALDAVAHQCDVQTVAADLSRPARVREQAGNYDIVVGALSSHLGLQTLAAVIEAGVNYVDISFMAENPLHLHAEAQRKGVTAVVDCGVAPGMSNMSAGWATTVLDPFEKLEIYVGGLPAERKWPFAYKAAFAPSDAIEEYTRPARMVEHGKVVVYPALSGVEQLDFDGVGTLEAFNTDGLRTLIDTLAVPTMIEKTMRYPGHAELMRVFRETGFFREEPIEIGGQPVVPLQLTSALLFKDWAYGPDEVDITVCRVIATGRDRNGEHCKLQWDLFDQRDSESGVRSMSRTTGYPAAIVARLVADGTFNRKGVSPPEELGRCEGLLDQVLAELAKRGVLYQYSKTATPPVA